MQSHGSFTIQEGRRFLLPSRAGYIEVFQIEDRQFVFPDGSVEATEGAIVTTYNGDSLLLSWQRIDVTADGRTSFLLSAFNEPINPALVDFDIETGSPLGAEEVPPPDPAD